MRNCGLLLAFFLTASAALSQTGSTLGPKPAFQHIELYSFGYSLAPSVPGTTGTSSLLSSGPFTVPGLDCPYCTIRPFASQSHFVLQPFGQTFVYRPVSSLKLFQTTALTQPLLPEYVVDRGMITPNGFRISERSKLLGSESGFAFSPDRNRRFWLEEACDCCSS